MGKLSILKNLPVIGDKIFNIYMKIQKRNIHRHNIKRVNEFSVDNSKENIYYLDVPVHTNLGDMAQYVCTKKWLKENYPEKNIVEIDGLFLSDKNCGIVEKLKTLIKPEELIFFQSGYCTQDLGGYHDEVHRLIVNNFPNNKIIMLPQTVYFQDKKNALRTSEIYNKHKNIFFLARDYESKRIAEKLFPQLKIYPYPDIVTTLIGTKDTLGKCRNGIMMCIRDDSEKFYSNEEINLLKNNLELISKTRILDTTVNESFSSFIMHAEESISEMIDCFSNAKLVITDRYHGTIFSLVANTPVIVIKTTDHKVKTGVDWFDGIYDDTVFFANNLEEAYTLAKKIIEDYQYKNLKPYFKNEYYDKLKVLIEK